MNLDRSRLSILANRNSFHLIFPLGCQKQGNRNCPVILAFTIKTERYLERQSLIFTCAIIINHFSIFLDPLPEKNFTGANLINTLYRIKLLLIILIKHFLAASQVHHIKIPYLKALFYHIITSSCLIISIEWENHQQIADCDLYL